jgi:TatA/E family protein of Tat protein translocase
LDELSEFADLLSRLIRQNFVTALSPGRLLLFRLRQYDERMGFSETIFIFFAALILFGPKKLPEIARQVGRALNEFKRASNEFKAQIEQEIAHLEREDTYKILPPTDAPSGTASRTLGATIENATFDAPTPAEPAATLALSEGIVAAENNNPPAVPATEADTPADPPIPSQESHV